MLVLTRRNGETLVLTEGDNRSSQPDTRIEITVLRISGNSVRLGVSAPDNVGILRAELEEEDAGVRTGVGPVRNGRPTR